MRKLTQKRTHQEFLEDFEKMQPDLFSKLEILSEYKNKRTNILVKDEFGKLLASPTSLLVGKNPTIFIALNKTQYFINKLFKVNPKFFKENTIIDNYTTCDYKMKIQSKYGICAISSRCLLVGSLPCIVSAINKNEYFINQAKEIHGNTYSYDLIDYKKGDTKIKIICKKHGVFTQKPNSHLNNNGCPKCGYEKTSEYNKNNPQGYKDDLWFKASKKSKHFDSYKFYIIKCWNNIEFFYKVGRTFTTVEKRFKYKYQMPYNYFVMYIEEGDYDFICKIEKSLHKTSSKYKYLPKIPFHGRHECFSNIKI